MRRTLPPTSADASGACAWGCLFALAYCALMPVVWLAERVAAMAERPMAAIGRRMLEEMGYGDPFDDGW